MVLTDLSALEVHFGSELGAVFTPLGCRGRDVHIWYFAVDKYTISFGGSCVALPGAYCQLH